MLALVSTVCFPTEDPADTLLSKRTLTCRDWALVANEYLALGETGAAMRLKRKPEKNDPFSTLAQRRGLLCRILFVPKGAQALRPPVFGGLSLPYRSMPLSRWPEYPFVQQDGVWFLLSEGYELAGVPEPTASYVDFCRKAGTFRKTPLAVPTSERAGLALDRLQGSPRWKAIRWSYEGQGETYTPLSGAHPRPDEGADEVLRIRGTNVFEASPASVFCTDAV